MKGKKSIYEVDGIVKVPKEEFQSFITHIRLKKYVYTTETGIKRTFLCSVNIPKPIREALQLKDQDFVQIAIRKADSETISDYHVPFHCPKCGKFVSHFGKPIKCSVCGWKQK